MSSEPKGRQLGRFTTYTLGSTERMIPTSRYLQYVRGYTDLGMVNEASDELEVIEVLRVEH